MTNSKQSLSVEGLAARIEDAADDLLARAERLWGWRKCDKTISIAIGDTSRALRLVAAALRSRSPLEDNSNG